MLQKDQSYGKIKTNRGWRIREDGKIESDRPGLCCPRCGFKIHKLLPQTELKDFVLYCRKCKKESIVNISSVPVP